MEATPPQKTADATARPTGLVQVAETADKTLPSASHDNTAVTLTVASASATRFPHERATNPDPVRYPG